MKVGTWFLLDLLSNPKFKGILDFSLPIIGKWLGSVYKILNTGVNWIMEAFGEKSLVVGALKIIGGLGAFFVATRVLQPWKLIGDYQSLVKFYRNTVGKTSWGKKLKRAQNIKRLRNERMKRVKRFGNMRNRIRARRTRMLRLKRLTRVKAGRFMQGKATGFLSKGMPFLAVLLPQLQDYNQETRPESDWWWYWCCCGWCSVNCIVNTDTRSFRSYCW
ncbi:MAG: hypothetical protein CM15mV13_0920 [uncultured marine virus]|nr:MAG: hypothetical protein CM15mV13_0920 [uncultured marine virus]